MNGSCICPPGFTGYLCGETCANGSFGEDCAQKCDCKNGATCSPETGQCQCPAGWEGQQCDRPCSNNSFGIHCNQKCVCKNGASCNPVNGKSSIIKIACVEIPGINLKLSPVKFVSVFLHVLCVTR